MNTAVKVMRKILNLDVTHVSEIGHQVARQVDAMARQINRLETKPVTFAALLLGRVKAELDVEGAEALLTRVDSALQPGDAMFRMEGDLHSLRAWRDQLHQVIDLAKTYAGVE